MAEPGLKIAVLADASHVNCQRWCEGLRDAGAQVHSLSFHVGDFERDGTYKLPGSPIATKLQYVTSVRYVRQLLNQIRPDVVIAYYVTGYGTLGALAGYHPLVLVTSGSDVLLAPQSRFMKRLVRYNLSKADLVTAWAPHMAKAAGELGVARERMLVLPRGIPYEHFARARCSLPAKNDCVKIISTRSLKADYNLERLVGAMRLLQNSGATFRLTLAGAGPQRQKLVALAERLNLQDRIRFKGFVSNDQLPSLLAEHHLYVSLI